MYGTLTAHLKRIKVPSTGDKVFKDECAYSFDTPESETGLYICMNTFLGLGKLYVEEHFKKTGNGVFLHIKRRRKTIQKASEDPPPLKKPTRLAIGVEGGFDANQKSFEFVEDISVLALPDWNVLPYPDPQLPEIVNLSAIAIIEAEDALKMEEAALATGSWEGDKRIISKHAENLLQLDNGKKIPPTGWKCEMCELTTNLWLNLTDGAILCGRRFFDGSGGNNHAVDYYNITKYPLAVKLGTITADGADVYSYDEDDMVEDPYLAKHLAHFGINIASLQKTEKTMVELEIDLNQKIGEWDVIQESGSQLTPLYGPGCTGMRNLGNSCYMNSVMQVIFTIPDFQEKYFDCRDAIFAGAPVNPTSDFNVQMAKLAHGLLSGEYSKPPNETEIDEEYMPPPKGIRPQMFKTLVGRGHPEFSSKRQQDAEEYFLHLINFIERQGPHLPKATDCFKYKVEEKVKCVASGKVRYTYRTDYVFAVPVHLDAAINKDEFSAYEAKKALLEAQGQKISPEALVRPRIPLTSCIEAFAAVETVDDFFSAALQSKSIVHKTTRFASFPNYLMVHLNKFIIGNDWVPKKLDVSMDIPDELDLTGLQGTGLLPGEEELPTESTEPEIRIDDSLVSQLLDMGFPLEACQKGVYYTQNNGLEAATNWVMEHMSDPDFDSPLELLSNKQSNSTDSCPDENSLAIIMSMGFSRNQAIKAMKATDNNVERAVDWVLSHTAELDAEMNSEPEPLSTSQSCDERQEGHIYSDGSGKYKLVAFISHMGTSTLVGHYVCHILKDDRWVIYNDEKVALSEHPPKDLGYLYFYKRM
ncbi:ubiquitin carboxyl-terminal hydrolase 5-like [Octopus vulgaris]|nr:ubiquitin carboxyl-terminal hydrolase 5-like [Octopus vulgaris]